MSDCKILCKNTTQISRQEKCNTGHDPQIISNGIRREIAGAEHDKTDYIKAVLLISEKSGLHGLFPLLYSTQRR